MSMLQHHLRYFVVDGRIVLGQACAMQATGPVLTLDLGKIMGLRRAASKYRVALWNWDILLKM